MEFTLQLTDEQAHRAHELAGSLGIQADEFLQATIADALNGPSEKVKSAVQRILREDKELYRRLA